MSIQSAIQWYKQLDCNTRINVKEVFVLLTGTSFESLNFMFSYIERIEIMYNKLKLEGII